MWESLFKSIQDQLSNQIVSGGLALGLAGVVVGMIHRLWPMLWGFLRRIFVVTAVIDSRNDVFQAVIKWLNALPYSQGTHFFSVTQEASSSTTKGQVPKLLYSPAPGWHLMRRGAHLISFDRTLDTNKLNPIETITISMLFARRHHFESLIVDILKANYGQIMGRTQLFVPDSWADDWKLHGTKPKRNMDSVILANGVRERIVIDVQQFHDRRQRYEALGIPWRRGYLLHGPPGTGKTSLIFALAGELNMSLCTLSLTNRKLSDQNLADLLQSSPEESIILIEDVDSFFQARQKVDEKMELSFSGLLNAIDGVAAQEGRVVFMTTNHVDQLDPALIRPGRIDVVYELGKSGKDELRRMAERFFPEATPGLAELVAAYPEGSLSPAEIQQALQTSETWTEAATKLRDRMQSGS
jgi:mitochondrial chaperone BCS1